jgi:DNA invertase Pin-like site-specific DNA recombinase
MHRVALYARVSTNDQHAENQMIELRSYCAARGWTITAEYIDHGISGGTTSRPQLNAMMQAARRRKFDAIVCRKLDRMGRSLAHLITLLEEIQPENRLCQSRRINRPSNQRRPSTAHLLAAFAQFERERIRERIHLGLDRARKQGKKLGRRARTASEPLTVRHAAALWGCSKSQAARRMAKGEIPAQSPA